MKKRCYTDMIKSLHESGLKYSCEKNATVVEGPPKVIQNFG